MTTVDNGRTNRSSAAKISRTLENALQYVRGTGQWFSARNKDAVISQLIEAQKELDKLRAIEGAARELITTPLPIPLDADADLDTMQRAKAALMHTREFQERLEALATALAAFDAAEGE